MNPDQYHIIPLDDLREHEASVSCWCRPSSDDDEPSVFVHHAMDGREQFESGGPTTATACELTRLL